MFVVPMGGGVLSAGLDSRLAFTTLIFFVFLYLKERGGGLKRNAAQIDLFSDPPPRAVVELALIPHDTAFYNEFLIEMASKLCVTPETLEQAVEKHRCKQ
jgi:hypothetical protein